MTKSLDLDAVRAFVLTADLGSFTRASEALGVAQAAISLKLKRLEDRLGYRLLDRTPRYVRLTPRGEGFMDLARELLSVHDRAVSGGEGVQPRRLAVGISDHVAGPDLPAILASLRAYDPKLIIEVRIAASRDLIESFDQAELDAALVRQEEARRGGKILMTDPMGWFASPGWHYQPDQALPLANMASPCGVRAIATKALDDAGIVWSEVFVGGGVMAVGAAVSAGIAIAALARRVAPAATIEVGAKLNLPPLPPSNIVLHSRAQDHSAQAALKTLAASFRASSR